MKKFILTAIVLVAAIFTNQLTAQTEAPKTVKLVQVEKEFTTKSITLKSGNYIFEVLNDGVDKELGFVIAPKGKTEQKNHIPEAYLVKTVKNGESAQSKVVTLEKGEYVYFCPLNPTPIYTLIVN